MPPQPVYAGERAVFRRLTTPEKIQRFLDPELAYNKEPDGATCRSPRRVLRDRTAHCMEGALFGAAALRMLGHPPLLLDLEAVRDDDHVLAIFRLRGRWGAVAKSNYSGLRYREPVYRTLRELVMSYFEHYYNLQKEKTLRRYSRPGQPVPLRCDRLDDCGRRRLAHPRPSLRRRALAAPAAQCDPRLEPRRRPPIRRRPGRRHLASAARLFPPRLPDLDGRRQQRDADDRQDHLVEVLAARRNAADLVCRASS